MRGGPRAYIRSPDLADTRLDRSDHGPSANADETTRSARGRSVMTPRSASTASAGPQSTRRCLPPKKNRTGLVLLLLLLLGAGGFGSTATWATTASPALVVDRTDRRPSV